MSVIKYDHHGKEVYVREELKGKHRDHCLCFICDNFNMDNKDKKCKVADMIYHICIHYNLTLPVWECPDYKEKGK